MLTIGLAGSATGCASTEYESISLNSHLLGRHYFTAKDLGNAFLYWNNDGSKNSSLLYEQLTSITSNYVQTHQYVAGISDCDDMVVDIWQQLHDRQIKALIAVGNIEKSNETFLECNHAWLMVFNTNGASIAVDVSRGRVFTWDDAIITPQLSQYWEGFIYSNPEDLKADFVERW